MPPAVEQFLEQVRQAVEQRRLVKLTLGDARGSDATLRNVYVRRVELRRGIRLSFCYRHTTRDLTRNLETEAGMAEIADQLGTVFGSAYLFTTEAEVQLDWPAGGEPRLRRRAVARVVPDSTRHDRTKARLIEASAPWLQALGVTTPEGKVRSDMTGKFRQIHRFLEILDHCLAGFAPDRGQRAEQACARGTDSHIRGAASIATGDRTNGLPDTSNRPAGETRRIRIVDMGCGKGYLTFATHEFLQRSGWAPEVLGIEARAELVESCSRVAQTSGCTGLSFRQGTITDTPMGGTDILVALHACDTATDDAIAKGVLAGAQVILVAPCCHRELRPQLRPPPALTGALRHGIFREREAEFVTDALRAALMEWAGYRTRVFEFIAAEHTAKNLMIAATKRAADRNQPAREAAVRALAQAYGIRHHHLARELGFALALATDSSASRP